MDAKEYVLDVAPADTHTFQDKVVVQAIVILVAAVAVHQEQADWY
jgi:hypothetical protein